MASLRAHLFDLMVRLGVKTRLGRRPDIARIRAVFGQKGFPPSPLAIFTPGRLGGVSGEWVRSTRRPPEDGPEHPRLLYLHGGGFVGCSPLTHRTITGAFARAGFRVFVPEYRLAPEHPFPAAIEDVVAAWTALSAEGAAVVAGDSAGGNLALVLIAEAHRLGLRQPAAAALFSPVCDFLARGASHRDNVRSDAMFRPELFARLAPAYLDGADPADPCVSPIEADFTGFPPLLLHAAEREMLRDDSVALAERARAAGVRVDLKIWPVVAHTWQLAETFLPEGRRSLVEAALFLRHELAAAKVEALREAVV